MFLKFLNKTLKKFLIMFRKASSAFETMRASHERAYTHSAKPKQQLVWDQETKSHQDNQEDYLPDHYLRFLYLCSHSHH